MRLPIIPTFLVAAAVAVMIGLGFWQLQRAGEKDALIAQLERNTSLPAIALPPIIDERLFFRRAAAYCGEVTGWRATGGRSAAGMTGTRHIAECRGQDGSSFAVDMGVSSNPRQAQSWAGGPVSGRIVAEPAAGGLFARLFGDAPAPRPLLISDRPAPGLEASRQPTPEGVTNNSLSYAFQWFFFAAAAAAIYLLALRRRNIAPGGRNP